MTTHLDSGVGGLFKMALTFISQNVDFFSSPTHPYHKFFFFFSSFYYHSLFFSSYGTVTISVTIEHVQFRRKKSWGRWGDNIVICFSLPLFMKFEF
jgi:hypothetical protein